MAFQPEAFGKYYLVDKIAVGGMAEIFKAKQFGPGGFEKVLVIKRILSHLGEDDDFIQMFRDEAMISSTLTHSNIIHVYDFGKIRNNYFIAMEYCEGKDLKTIMKKCQEIGRPLPVEYAVYIIHEVCKGLDYAHRKKDSSDQELNILHRDISPSNVMISYEEGRVKLADFGIAKAENASYKTKAGVLKGKFEYMSPEQASGLSIDRRSDLFAVGITFYELLTRRRLFKTDSDLKTLELIRNPIIPPPSHLNPQVREDLDAIVMKALARKPEERYQEAWQLQHALREYMRASTPPTSPDLIALSLSNFIKEIFDREIRVERERLEAGTRLARELIESSRSGLTDELEYEENWEIPSGNSRVTSMTNANAGGTAVRLMIEEQKQTSSSRTALVGGGVAAGVVGMGLLLMSLQGEPSQGTAAVPIQSAPGGVVGVTPLPYKPVPRRAALRVNALPHGSRILINGRYVGDSPLVLEEFPLGEHFDVRVEREGHKSHQERFLLKESEIRDLNITLPPERKAPDSRVQAPPQTTRPNSTPAPAPEPATAGKVEFFSTPPGATVKVDGRTLCVTPCGMENGQANATYRVELSLEGHESYQTRLRFPADGTAQVNGTLSRIQLGYLTITIKDFLSAELFVDGQKKGHSAFFEKVPVPAGRRNIRLRNPVTGAEKSLEVDISAGQEEKLGGVELLGGP